jgi:hypothetical protein
LSDNFRETGGWGQGDFDLLAMFGFLGVVIAGGGDSGLASEIYF